MFFVWGVRVFAEPMSPSATEISARAVVFRRNVPDLHNYRVQGSGNKDWNNRISSTRINSTKRYHPAC
jgi:hypothetical protein